MSNMSSNPTPAAPGTMREPEPQISENAKNNSVKTIGNGPRIITGADRLLPVKLELSLDQIDVEAGIESRPINEDVVQEYTELMKAGTVFPEVEVFKDKDKYYLVDGNHRVSAARMAGLEKIMAIPKVGGRLEALEAALGANLEHGLRRSIADKRYAVDKALKEFANLGYRNIAEMCHVSPTFVSERQRLLESTVHVDSSPGEAPKKRLGRDGKTRRHPKRSMAKGDNGGSAEAKTAEKSEPTVLPEVTDNADETGPVDEKETEYETAGQEPPETFQPQRRDDTDKIALEKAKQALAKLAGKLGADRQTLFWQQIATFAIEQAEAMKTSSC
jgi:ParB-like chromosome segregation protein Spo0J